MLLTSFLSSYPAQNGSNVMCEFDVGARGETDRAVREIVREEVRALLPSIAREVASLVEQNESGDAAGGEGEVEGEAGMLEIALPGAMMDEADSDIAALLFVEHDGFVRHGARLPGLRVDAVRTYDLDAFEALRSAFESRQLGETSN